VALFSGLLVWGLLGAHKQFQNKPAPHHRSDITLYRAIIEGLQHGGGYYRTAINLQDKWGYPTTPQVTVRLPALAEFIALVGPTVAWCVLVALITVTSLLFIVRLDRLSDSRLQWYLASAGFGITAGLYVTPSLIYMHEVWAGLFISLALVLRSDSRWWPAVALGIAAACIRETALVYGAAMGVLALWQRRWSEAAAWAAGAAAFFGYLAWHFHEVNVHQVADPPRSPGWLVVKGWPFIVESMQASSPLVFGPIQLAAILTPFLLLGLFFLRRDQMTLRLLATVLGFCLVFFFLGRNNNIYWGMLYAPLIFVGIGFAPLGVVSLARALRRPPDC
jgi:hypothetical protein